MANNSSLSKRAALRQQQEMEERNKRTKRILSVGAVLVAITVVTVLAIVIMQAMRTTTVAGEQLTPPNSTDRNGILLAGNAPQEGTPHLVVWEDFQCPACAAREEAYGPVIAQLVADGEITAEIRTAYFLDTGLMNDSSERAALAAAAADEVGAYDAYHEVVYANHPAVEGDGFTDDQLRGEFASLAGIEGDDLVRFQELYDTRAFQDFVTRANDQFTSDGIGATPTYLVAGQELSFFDQDTQTVLIDPTTESMMTAINEAFAAGGESLES